jgi:hypothetical protein
MGIQPLLKNLPKVAQVPGIALTLMLIGILLPTAFYSFRLSQSSPTAADLLVAVCIALFSSVLFLWIMDATSILPFRAQWISKSVYGAAIVSILGTSVGVYKNFFNSSKYPFDGAWQVILTSKADPTHPTEFLVVLTYSEAAAGYWGYSNVVATSHERMLWAEVTDFAPEERTFELRATNGEGTQIVYRWPIKSSRKGRLFESEKESSDLSLELRRPG